jgi:oxygen-dependent protoporphyrinogen oxidase
MPRIVVVGGGIAGLAAAYALRDRAEVTLLEATDRVGGKLRTSEIAGVAVDEGAESMLARVPEAVGLAREIGCDIVHPATPFASIWVNNHLRPLPSGTVLGVPTTPGPLMRSRILSLTGMLRAGADLVLPRTPLPEDPAVGAYVRARVGAQVLDRLVDPLLGGVYAGRADELSLRATVPQLVPAIRHRSLIYGARAALPPPSDAPVFATVPDGLGAFAAALADRCGADVRLGHAVRELRRTPDGWQVDEIAADAVILAVPAAAARRLLVDVAPYASALLGGVPYASVAVATFAFRGVDFPAGSGFLVPQSERRVMKAATFSSRKWSHLDRDGLTFVRCSAGRAGEESDLQRDDDELTGVLAAELGEATGVHARPVAVRLTRWGGALPQYLPGHLDRVAGIRAALPDGISVCGAAYDGVGVPACIRSARAAAAAVVPS